MANTQVTTRDTQLEKQRIGLLQLTLTNFANTAEPAIAAGSVVEVGGSLYVFSSDEAITGWGGISNDTDAYIKLVPGVSLVTAEFVEAAPTWSALKQGWYIAVHSYIGCLRRGASDADYEDKWIYQRSQDNNDTHRISGTGDLDMDGDLDVGGGAAIAGNAVIGGTGQFDQRVLEGDSTNIYMGDGFDQNDVFDALSPLVPNIGDVVAINGHAATDLDAGGGGRIAVKHYIAVKRATTTRLRFAGMTFTYEVGGLVTRNVITFADSTTEANNGDAQDFPYNGFSAVNVFQW